MNKISLSVILLFVFVASPSYATVSADLIEIDLKEAENDSSEKGFFEKIFGIFNDQDPSSNIVTYKYDQNVAYPIRLKTSVATVIHLPENEKVTFLSSGDKESFFIRYDKNTPNIIDITTLSNKAESNLVVHTNVGSTYNFYLKSNFDERKENPNYTVYVTKTKDQEFAGKKKLLLSELKKNNDYIKRVKSLEKLNTSYTMEGDKDIAPVFVYDDGSWTYFDFGQNFVSDRMPNAYKIIDKFDSVVNTRVKGNLLVAQSLSVEGWTLKNGDKYVCIRPDKNLLEVYRDDRFK